MVLRSDFYQLLQIIIWWAGLMRGAVSIALAFNQVIHAFYVFPSIFLLNGRGVYVYVLWYINLL
jgi:hypothetical protein